MIHIKRQQLSLNKPLNEQSDTDMLSNTYQSIIDRLSLNILNIPPTLIYGSNMFY